MPVEFMALLFVPMPFVAFVISIIFYLIFRKNASKTALVAALLWFVYGTYESMLKFGYLCPEGCNIRIDLAFIYTILLFSSTLVMAKLLNTPNPQQDF